MVMVGSKRLLSSSGAAAATAKSCGLMLELRLRESGEAFKSEQKAITALLSLPHHMNDCGEERKEKKQFLFLAK